MPKIKVFPLGIFIIFLFSVSNIEAQNCNIGSSSTTPPAGISVFIGDDEEFSALNNRGTPSMASRVALDAQDDTWRSDAIAKSLTNLSPSWTGGTGATTANTASTALNLFTYNSVTVTAALHNIVVSDADCDGTINGNQGNLSDTDTMQDSSPRPEQFYNAGNQPRYWTENAGSSSNRNAIVFEFSTPIRAFGAWFGDAETRNDGMATPMLLRLVDSSGNRIGNDTEITPNGTPNQSICGGGAPSSSPSACGNETTRWIGFTDSMMTPRVSQAIIIIGDDDLGGNGNTQHMSFIGATIATIQPTAALASVSGRVTTLAGRGIFRAIIKVINATTGEEKITKTNQFGYFRVRGLEVGDFYFATVQHKSYQFENNFQSFQLFENFDGLRFVSGFGSIPNENQKSIRGFRQ